MDQAHAHPSSDSLPLSSARNNNLGPRPFRSVHNTPSPLLSPQYREAPFSLQHRRLQLRNSGFRAPRLPTHKISGRLSRFLHGHADPGEPEIAPHRNQENTTPTSRGSTSRCDHRPSASGTILYEITNSARSRNSQKTSIVPIFEDRPISENSSPTSWYNDSASTWPSPITSNNFHVDADEMKLRDVSGNERRTPPPLSSPLAMQIKGRKKRGLDLRKTSFQASQYIEHIENELEEVKQALQSPSTGKPLHDKLKAQKTEIRELKQVISDLERSFEGRVKEAVEHKTTVEMELRKKIKLLEDELSSRECAIKDLEYRNDQSQPDQINVETLKATIERLELEKRGLEDTNRTIEKRNDLLTELLGHSPTRLQHGFELASPIRSNSRNTPRPKSMLPPRIPSSPRTAYRPLSVQASPANFNPFSPPTALAHERNHPCNDDMHVDPQKGSDSQSLDSGLGESCSIRSGPEYSSKRSSMVSQTSITPSAWGLPLSSSPTEDNASGRDSRKRKTRRFASGSTSLKPLVLPGMAAANNMPHSAGSRSSPSRREFSDTSMDPTTSFLSHPFDTPTQPERQPVTWASEDALKALEGVSEQHFESFEDVLAQHEAVLAGHIPSPFSNELPAYLREGQVEHRFSSNLTDEIIPEEDVTAFLDGQMPSAEGNQSFSSMIGEVSFPESDTGRAGADDRDLATQYSEVELPASANFPPKLNPTSPYAYLPVPREMGTLTPSMHSAGPMLDVEPTALDSPPSSPPRALESRSNVASGPDPLEFRFEVSPNPRKRRKSSAPSDTASSSPTPRSRLVDGASNLQKPPQPRSSHKSDITMGNTKKDSGIRRRHKAANERAHSPLETLHRKASPNLPLTAVTARTIFGTISRYTSYIREIRRDPTALARRVITNAWRSNWKRLGMLSWWVLGLFLGPGVRREETMKRIELAGWDWDQYSAEDIAQRTHDEMNGPDPDVVAPLEDELQGAQTTRSVQERHVKFDEHQEGYRTSGTRTKAKVALKSGSSGKGKHGWGKSLYLWGKFSVAIIIAVGGAVVKGPEEMLKDCDPPEADIPKVDCLVSGGRRVCTPRQQNDHDYDSLFDDSADFGDGNECDWDNDESSKMSLLGAPPVIVSATRPSNTPSPARIRKQKSLPALKTTPIYTFGSPSVNEWDRFDDNGGGRPVKARNARKSSRLPVVHQNDTPKRCEGLGPLKWTENLSIADFHEVDRGPNIPESGGWS